MAFPDTTFVSKQTVITQAWAQAVNDSLMQRVYATNHPTLQDAIDTAILTKSDLVLEPGTTYTVTTALTVSGTLRIFGNGATLDGSAIAAAASLDSVYALKIEGSIGNAVSIGANLNEGAVAITSTTTTGVVADDYILVYSTNSWPIGDTGGGRFMGAVHRVRSITSSTALALYDGAFFSMTTAAGLSFKKLTPVKDVEVRDLKIVMGGANKAHCGIRIKNAVRCKLVNCQTDATEDCGVRLDTAVNCGVYGGDFGNCTSPDAGSSGVTGTTGYGVNPASATRDCEVVGASMRNTRHGVAGGGTYPSIGTRVVHNYVDGNRSASLPSTYALDCHEDCLYWVFDGNHINGDSASTGAAGILVRGLKTTVINNTVTNSAQYGIYVINYNNPGNPGGAFIANNTIINCRVDGIVVEGSATSPQYDITITGNYVYALGEGVTLFGTERAVISNNIIKAQIGATKSAIRLVGTAASTGNRCKDIVISGNLTTAPTLNGVKADYADSVSIAGNTFVAAAADVIALANCTNVDVGANRLSTPYNFGSAISLSACVGVAIAGVTAKNTGAASGTASGVYISGASTDISVSGCTFLAFNRGVYSVAPANYITAVGINGRTCVTTAVDVSASANTATAGNL